MWRPSLLLFVSFCASFWILVLILLSEPILIEARKNLRSSSWIIWDKHVLLTLGVLCLFHWDQFFGSRVSAYNSVGVLSYIASSFLGTEILFLSPRPGLEPWNCGKCPQCYLLLKAFMKYCLVLYSPSLVAPQKNVTSSHARPFWCHLCTTTCGLLYCIWNTVFCLLLCVFFQCCYLELTFLHHPPFPALSAIPQWSGLILLSSWPAAPY